MSDEIQKGRYRHYKGNEYQVIDCVTHSESLEKLVLYRPLYGEGKLWVRPYKMFFETLTTQDKEVARFEYIAEI